MERTPSRSLWHQWMLSTGVVSLLLLLLLLLQVPSARECLRQGLVREAGAGLIYVGMAIQLEGQSQHNPINSRCARRFVPFP